MPLFQIKTPSVPVRSFRSLVFDDTLEVILETPALVKKTNACDIALIGSMTGIDEKGLYTFTKKEQKGSFALNTTFRIDLDARTITVKGYKIESFGGGETYLCSSNGPEHVIHYTFSNEVAVLTLYYLYHMITCV